MALSIVRNVENLITFTDTNTGAQTLDFGNFPQAKTSYDKAANTIRIQGHNFDYTFVASDVALVNEFVIVEPTLAQVANLLFSEIFTQAKIESGSNVIEIIDQSGGGTLNKVTTSNTSTVVFSGLGTQASPLSAVAATDISPDAGNIIVQHGNGIYAPTPSGTGNVDSVFGRTGVVTAQTGDYNFNQIGQQPSTLGGYGITDGAHTQPGSGTRAVVANPDGSFFTDVNAYPTDMIWGREYVFAFHKKLYNGLAPIVTLSGDSTTVGVGIQNANFKLDAIIGAVAQRVTSQGCHVFNDGVTNTGTAQWIGGQLAGTLARNPDLMIIRWGLNDPSLGVAQFEANLRQGLTTIRAQGNATQITVILMAPSSTNDDPNGRNATWYELINPVIRKAAKDFMCCYIDTFHFWHDSTDATDPLWMSNDFSDGRHINPGDVMNMWITSKILDVMFPTTVRSILGSATLQNNGSTVRLPSSTDAPSTYPQGISIFRATTGNGWPADGQVVTFYNPDGIWLQLNNASASTGFSYRTGSPGNWNAFVPVGGSGGVSSFNGRTGAVLPQTDDYTFSQIGSKPNTLAGYGITDGAKNYVFDITAYGAVGDGRRLTDVNMTSGSAVLTSASANFTLADVGKPIRVWQGGVAGADFVTTIASFTNSTTVTLGATASTSVPGGVAVFGTDDTAAIQAAINAAGAHGGGTIFVPNGVYIVAGPLQTNVGGANPNAQITFPIAMIPDNSWNLRTHFIIQGETKPNFSPLSFSNAYLPNLTGPLIYSIINGSGQAPAIFGTKSSDTSFTVGLNFNYVTFKNLHIMTPQDIGNGGTSIGGINGYYLASLIAEDVVVSVDGTGDRSVKPTNEVAGIMLSAPLSEIMSRATNVVVVNYKYGIVLGDDAYLDNYQGWLCEYACVIPFVAEDAYIGRMVSQWCNYGIFVPNAPILGYVTHGISFFKCDSFMTEVYHATGNWWDQIATVYDPNNLGTGIVFYTTVRAFSGVHNLDFVQSGGANINCFQVGSGVYSMLQGLDSVLATSNTSTRQLQLTGFNGTAPNAYVNTITFQSILADNNHIGNNVFFNGGSYQYVTDGYASQIIFNQAGLTFKQFAHGTAGGNAGGGSQPFIIDNAGNIGMGGSTVSSSFPFTGMGLMVTPSSVLIRTTSDASGYLSIGAGVSTPGGAPVKLAPGALLAAIEDGALEYGSNHLYFSIGSSRFQLDRQASGGFTPAFVFNVKDYGALGNGVEIADATIFASSSTLTTNTTVFTSADVGKLIKINGAGPSGIDLVATITTINAANSITISVAASTGVAPGVARYGNDDTTHIQTAINAAFSAGGGKVYIPKGMYIINGPMQTSIDGFNPNSQLYVHMQPSSQVAPGTPITISIEGEAEAQLAQSVAIIQSQPPINGTVLCSFLLTASGTYPSMFATGDVNNDNGFNGVDIYVRNIMFQVVGKPTGGVGPIQTGLNLGNFTDSTVEGVQVTIDIPLINSVQPTNECFGIIYTATNGGTFMASHRTLVSGFKYGHAFGEHFYGEDVQAMGCVYAFCPGGANHVSHIVRAGAYWCKYAIASVISYASPLVHHGLSVDQLSVEADTANWWAQVNTIYDPSNLLFGSAYYGIVRRGVGYDNSLFSMAGGAGFHPNPLESQGASTAETLDQVLGNGNTSTKQLLLQGFNQTLPNLTVGDITFQSFSPDNNHIGNNVYFNGATYVYVDNGYGGQIILTQGGLIFKQFGNGTGGGNAGGGSHPFVIGNDGNIAMGGTTNSTVAPFTGSTVTVTGTSVLIGTTTDNGATLQVNGTITTADPGHGVEPWKLGSVVTAASTVDTTRYVEVSINGVVVKLAVCS